MAKLIYGFDPHALQQSAKSKEDTIAPLTAAELHAIGVPPRKIPRVQEEITRLALQNGRFLDRHTLAKLALELEKQFK